jgi:hypothetical protein
VKVTPTEGGKAYYWLKEGNPTITVRKETLNNHPTSKEHLSGRHFAAFIKKKFGHFAH